MLARVFRTSAGLLLGWGNMFHVPRAVVATYLPWLATWSSKTRILSWVRSMTLGSKKTLLFH